MPSSAFTNKFGTVVNIAFWAVLLIAPGLIGVLVGAPLIASELEYGTWRLAWSQTVPRTRWLAAKLALVTGGLVLFGAAATAVITWYRAPMDRLTGHFLHNIYDFEGLVLTAYILCAFGFAVLAGLLHAPQHPGHDRRVHPVAGHPARGRVPAPPALPGPADVHQANCTQRMRRPASASCHRRPAASATGC